MHFIADFHIHSKFSRATSKSLDLEHLFIAAQLKGITVVGTGDFTHPGWYAELCQKLEPAEDGLFKLRDDLAHLYRQQLPDSCRNPVRFILTTEISNIYKKNDITRKNHNLLFLPHLESVKQFSAALEKIGNIHSDGRPILGLDARHLLELLLDTDPDGFLIPAHIWTPWFSLFGSKSGFDSLQECFEDLSDQIFALETGLSSDPAMNWRVSELDRFTLVSNSDAHSPLKIGREANLFDTQLSYAGIHSAMQSGQSDEFAGTIEFFPEEGKYHLDGHRKCQQLFWPEQTRRINGICPSCGKPLTLGVLNRVEELADRPSGYQPEKRPAYECLIPLDEVLSEILRVGTATKRVRQARQNLLAQFGPELSILRIIDPRELNRSGLPLLAEAIRRIRGKKVHLTPGYDGQFGTIRLFEAGEREKLTGQATLFGDAPIDRPEPPKHRVQQNPATGHPVRSSGLNLEPCAVDLSAGSVGNQTGDDPIMNGLNAQQRAAVMHDRRPLLIAAGPGTGKTLTLTRRIAYLLDRCDIAPENILALTFTHKAAREMEQRLEHLLPRHVRIPKVATFHAFCYAFLYHCDPERCFKVIDSNEKSYFLNQALLRVQLETGLDTGSRRHLHQWIESAKQQLLSPERIDSIIPDPDRIPIIKAVYQTYQTLLSSQGLWDFEDLVFLTVNKLETDAALRRRTQKRYSHVLVDEYQDLNLGQYRLVKALTVNGRDLFVIGDPDQAIYGFRGASSTYFHRFQKDFGDTASISLFRNYRSGQTILDAAYRVIEAEQTGSWLRSRLVSSCDGPETLTIIETASQKSEAVAVGQLIEALIGGTGFHSFDFDRVETDGGSKNRSFSDFAVLFRIGRQAETFIDVFNQAGIPYQLANRDDLLGRPGIREILSILRLTANRATYADLETSAACLANDVKPDHLRVLAQWGLSNALTVRQALSELYRTRLPGLGDRQQRALLTLVDTIERFRNRLDTRDVRGKLLYIIDQLTPVLGDTFTENAAALEQVVEQGSVFETDTPAFLEQAALQSDSDVLVQKAEKVVLSTMHAAKGLEFPVVFVVGCEARLLPYCVSERSTNNLDEERRLFYVAMTRARESLYFTYARRRRMHGKQIQCHPSPFLEEIRSDLKTCRFESKSGRPNKKQVQLSLFSTD